MTAVKQNIVCKDRNKLEDVIPLDTPYSVAIDPCNLCNFKCSFCAIQYKEEHLSFKKQIMDKALFKKIIDDLSHFPHRLKVLRINGQGEPLLNPHLPEMIKYAKDREVADFIEIITNGSRLNPKLNQELVDSGVDRIRISIEALDAEGYQEISNVKLDFDEFINNIKDLHDKSGKCEIYCKIVDVAVPEDADKEKFYQLFGNICDRMFIDSVIPLWSDFEELSTNSSVGMHGQEIVNVKVCPYSFYSLIINSDGDVTACCADWKRKLIFGNLRGESFSEIWHSSQLKSFWMTMLKGEKDRFEVCQKCLLPMYDCNDNIDAYAEKILERM